MTYKHLESCDYAIKIFNNIHLYNQQLRVQFSQNSSQGQLQQQRNDSFNNGNSSNNQGGGGSSSQQQRLNRNASSSAGLNSRNQSQTRQDYGQQQQQQQQQFIAPGLMAVLTNASNSLMSQSQGQQQQYPNSFHRFLLYYASYVSSHVFLRKLIRDQ